MHLVGGGSDGVHEEGGSAVLQSLDEMRIKIVSVAVKEGRDVAGGCTTHILAGEHANPEESLHTHGMLTHTRGLPVWSLAGRHDTVVANGMASYFDTVDNSCACGARLSRLRVASVCGEFVWWVLMVPRCGALQIGK